MVDTDHVPFSHRYGFSDPVEVFRWCNIGPEDFDEERWRFRHCGVEDSEVTTSDELPEPLFRCVCPGAGKHGCMSRASQEDRLCDACREHCWAVTAAKSWLRFVDVHGEARY